MYYYCYVAVVREQLTMFTNIYAGDLLSDESVEYDHTHCPYLCQIKTLHIICDLKNWLYRKCPILTRKALITVRLQVKI